jgi:hypothetical protein
MALVGGAEADEQDMSRIRKLLVTTDSHNRCFDGVCISFLFHFIQMNHLP